MLPMAMASTDMANMGVMATTLWRLRGNGYSGYGYAAYDTSATYAYYANDEDESQISFERRFTRGNHTQPPQTAALQ